MCVQEWLPKGYQLLEKVLGWEKTAKGFFAQRNAAQFNMWWVGTKASFNATEKLTAWREDWEAELYRRNRWDVELYHFARNLSLAQLQAL